MGREIRENLADIDPHLFSFVSPQP